MPTTKRTVSNADRSNRARRGRRTYAELFVAKLKEISGSEQGPVNNGTLRDQLKWDEELYARIKGQLVSEGQIVRSRGGPGGSVNLVGQKDQALKVFVSYSHVDEKLKDALVRHLKPLERMSLISGWHDRKLLAGDDWDAEISRNLEAADIVLLLVSIDFVNSKYCYDIELDRALERHAAGACRVVPVILRGCLWQHARFSKLQALPRDGKPATTWTDLDEALSTVAEGVRLVAEDILASR